MLINSYLYFQPKNQDLILVPESEFGNNLARYWIPNPNPNPRPMRPTNSSYIIRVPFLSPMKYHCTKIEQKDYIWNSSLRNLLL